MTSLTIQDIKTHGAKALPSDEAAFIISNSQIKWAAVPIDIYNMLTQALEQLEDNNAIKERQQDDLLTAAEVFPQDK